MNEKSRGILTQLIIFQLLSSLEYKTWFWNYAKTFNIHHIIQYANNLIFTFMNIDDDMGN